MLQNLIELVSSPVVLLSGAFILTFVIGMGGGWLASNWSSAKDADQHGESYIYWRARRYIVVRDHDRRGIDEHGTMAEQSWR